jgi:hypothetical protein
MMLPTQIPRLDHALVPGPNATAAGAMAAIVIRPCFAPPGRTGRRAGYAGVRTAPPARARNSYAALATSISIGSLLTFAPSRRLSYAPLNSFGRTSSWSRMKSRMSFSTGHFNAGAR